MTQRKSFLLHLPRYFGVGILILGLGFSVAQAQDKPNILVIWGDDIGQSNISAYTKGLMGYRTPNIDRIADEGMIFTKLYGRPFVVYHGPKRVPHRSQ